MVDCEYFPGFNPTLCQIISITVIPPSQNCICLRKFVTVLLVKLTFGLIKNLLLNKTDSFCANNFLLCHTGIALTSFCFHVHQFAMILWYFLLEFWEGLFNSVT